ncbi:FAD-dependent monooxygenase [Chondrinema litorale]|uniref:FAD-dependent monooxygenase n=1 Tax=Chondrinema litorale TaxID=2994555 RepID=UPI0025437AE5|nr:FAD-dependent monooxygenase [Chondrinema litorale]UZR94708.1 FAD-dependent monooxygenase [Chondrinema litorale]
MKILIVGGGIAGLGLANILNNKSDIEITVIEKEGEWHIAGSGLYTPYNGVKVLDDLGLGEMAREKGHIISRRLFFDAKGQSILDLDLEEIWAQKKPCLGLNRKDLHEVLLSNLKNLNIHFNCTIKQVQEIESEINVTFSNGEKAIFDLVIVADGINSETRKATLGDIPFRLDQHQVCRLLINKPASINNWTMFGSNDGIFLIIPISKEIAYCYISNKNSATLSKEEFLKPFRSFASPVSDILSNEDNLKKAYWSKVEELAPLETYGKSKVVLIGDAAHAMPPYMAQGGSLALEDAYVLGKMILEGNNKGNWAQAFTDKRKERIDWVRARNRKREQLAKVPFWLAKIGLRFTGKKNWIKDYYPLRTGV